MASLNSLSLQGSYHVIRSHLSHLSHQSPAVLSLSNPPHVARSEQGVLGGVIHHSLPDIDDGVPGDIGPGAPPETAHHPLLPGNAGVGVQNSPGQ